MEIVVYKEDIRRRVLYPFSENASYEHFIQKIMKFSILEKSEDKYLIEVPDTCLSKQIFNGKEWFKSRDNKFGVFLINDEHKMVFQR